MGFRIATNIMALRTYHYILKAQSNLERSLERLSTGLRINRAGDDIAGWAISEGMRTQILGLRQAEHNALDAISFIHVAEGGMEAINEKLQRLRQLAIQASTETYTSSDREKIQMEVDQLVAEIDRLASAVQFNQIRMLKGGEYDIHVGSGANETIRISISSVDVDALGIRNLSVTGATNTNAENAVTSLDAAISLKIMARSRLGSYEVRLGGIVESLRVMQENQAAARSRIMDLDFAKEVMNLTRNQILVQVGLAMLAQANLHSQAVLNLL